MDGLAFAYAQKRCWPGFFLEPSPLLNQKLLENKNVERSKPRLFSTRGHGFHFAGSDHNRGRTA
jgi:hypothetical protein